MTKKIDLRTVRFQLQREAQALGLRSRRGGFSILFLQDFILRRETGVPLTKKTIRLSRIDKKKLIIIIVTPKQKLMLKIDDVERRQNIAAALNLKKTRKNDLKLFGLTKDLQRVIDSLDTRKTKRGGARSKKTWQEIKSAQIQSKGFTQKQWREFRNRQQIGGQKP